MRRIDVKQLDYDLTPVAGLALVGHYLKALQPAWQRLDSVLPVRSGVTNSDILRSYLGLLVLGRSDFDAVEGFRGDVFFKQALGVTLLPSSPTLRQRLDARAAEMFEVRVHGVDEVAALANPSKPPAPLELLIASA